MDRDVAGVQLCRPGQASAEACRRIRREPGNQVHVDVLKTGPHRLTVGPDHILSRVGPPAGPEHGVLHGLGIDAHAVRPMVKDDPELLVGQRVRPPALYGEFQASGEIQMLPEGIQQPCHLALGQGGGGAAPNIEGAHMASGGAQQLPGQGDLLQKGLQIGLQQLGLFAYGPADEAAIAAPGGAEGDAYIQRKILRLRFADGRHRGDGAVHRQGPPGRGHVVNILQEPVRGFGGASLQQLLGGQLGGPDPCQSAPGGLLGKQLDGRQIDTLLERAPAQPDGFLCRLQPPGGAGSAAVPGDASGGGEPGFPSVETGAGIHLSPFREETEEQLLYGITVVVTGKS